MVVLCPCTCSQFKTQRSTHELLETMPARTVDGARSRSRRRTRREDLYSFSFLWALPPVDVTSPLSLTADARASSLLLRSLPQANGSHGDQAVRAAQGLRMELVSLSAEGIPLQPRRLSHLGVILLHCADRAPWFGRLLAPRLCVISSTRTRIQDRCVYARHRAKCRAPMSTSPRVEEDWICHSLPCHRHRRPYRRP